MVTYNKTADVITPLQPHQRRVVERIEDPDQPGLVVAHGLGSGKTLSSIAAAEALGGPTTVLVPAALRANYEKEIAKHVDDPQAEYDISSLQRAARSGKLSPTDLLIVDEAHRLRNPQSKSTKAVAAAEAKKRLLLTGTPLYNNFSDLVTLVNVAAGEPVLPQSPAEFSQRYLGERTVNPSWYARTFKGIKPGVVPYVKNAPELRKTLQRWVDYHENALEGFPSRNERVVEVGFSPKQEQIYNSVLGNAPAWVRYKVENKLPLNKQESKDINAFANAVRQIAVSPGGFDTSLTPLQAAKYSPKITTAFNNFSNALKTNPNHKAVVYSNYLDSGLAPYEALLQQAEIPYGKFTGSIKKSERDQMVQDYNEGKIKALLVSSAGGEGLDLKGTRQIQILEPHWNKEKLEQVVGRGIRYKSHEHLPEDQRNVDVEHYVTVHERPTFIQRMFGEPRRGGIDEWLRRTSEDKERINKQLRDLMRRRDSMEKVSSDRAYHHAGITDALRELGLYTVKRAEDLTRLSEEAEDAPTPEEDHEAALEQLEHHLDDAGIALMASPYAAELIGSGLQAVPYAPIRAAGSTLRSVLGKESPFGHSSARELAGLALVAPSITKSIAHLIHGT